MLLQWKREGSERATKPVPRMRHKICIVHKAAQKCRNCVLKLHREAVYSKNIQCEEKKNDLRLEDKGIL